MSHPTKIHLAPVQMSQPARQVTAEDVNVPMRYYPASNVTAGQGQVVSSRASFEAHSARAPAQVIQRQHKIAPSSAQTSSSSSTPDMTGDQTQIVSTNTNSKTSEPTFPSVVLGVPEDLNHLNEIQCLVRSQCVEIFAATHEHVKERSKGKGSKVIRIGQVGIRCIYCRHQLAKNQANQASSFPSKLDLLYESVRNWQRFHIETCSLIPARVRNRYRDLRDMGMKPGESRQATRHYFAVSAEQLGLRDVPNGHGICFVDHSGRYSIGDIDQDRSPLHNKCDTEPSGDAKVVLENALSASSELIKPTDKRYITDFVYLLYNQLQPAVFSNERDGKKFKNHGKGYPGLECKHCTKLGGKHGRYFPSSVKGLSSTWIGVCRFT